MPRRPLLVIFSLVGLVATTARVATAQAGSTSNRLEFGIDAGATFGFGDVSTTQITLPASRFRVGFLMSDNSRWSIEPAAFLQYSKVEDFDGIFTYSIEVGALYHLRPPADLFLASPASVMYVRPFIGVTGISGADDDDSEFSAGAGFGIKIPWQANTAWRLEANGGYGFDNEAFRLGLLAGISFFTK